MGLAFITAFNQIAADWERYIDALFPVLDVLADTSELEKEEQILKERAAGLYARLEAQISDIADEKQARGCKRQTILQFIETVRERGGLLTRFDEPLFRAVVEKITVRSLKEAAVTFRDGREVTADARLKKFEDYAG